MTDELSGNIIEQLSRRGKSVGFSGERMRSLLEGIWNKVEYGLRDSLKSAGLFEECSDPKVMQSVLNGRTFKYHFWGEVGFICFISPIKFLTASV